MIQLSCLSDVHLIKAALQKDNLYKDIYDTELWADSLIHLSSIYFLASEKGKVIGLLEVSPESNTSASFHGGIYKDQRGNTKKHLADALEQLKKALPNYTFWTRMLGSNASRRLVEKMGCHCFGKLEQEDDAKSIYFYRWN